MMSAAEMPRRTTYADVFLCASLGEEKYDEWKRKEKEMAGQVQPPSGAPNFKPSREQRKKEKNRDKRADRPGNSEAHLALIRKLPCVCCGILDERNDPHHLLSGTGERGGALRSSDRWAVPVCRAHHDELHRVSSRGEARFFRQFGYDSMLDLCAGLWAVTGDLEKMRNVILANRRAVK